MKIISKYKDYYDYLAGINGIDEKLILDRSKFTPTPTIYSLDEGKLYTFHVCGLRIEVIYTNEQFYCGELLKKIELPWNRNKYDFGYSKKVETHALVRLQKGTAIVARFPYKLNIKDEENINEILQCPILIETGYGGDISYQQKTYSKFPVLKDYNIGSVLSPEKIWNMLYDFLAKSKDIPNTQTDKQKIIGKGFDYKHSFRNTK